MHILKLKTLSMIFIATAMAFVLSSCNEEETNPVDSDMGRLQLEMTDAPMNLDLVSEANVTISHIEARRVQDEDTTNPFIEIYNETETYNLLELRNGVTEKLADIEVPAGSYDLIRMYVDNASLTLTNGMTYDVKVPSGEQTGIKVFIDPALQVEGGLTSELLLDFDVSQSFVLKGNPDSPAGIKGFNFKPVIRAVNKTTAGRIEGIVKDTSSNAVENAAVWIENDTVVTTTYSDTTGGYALLGVEEGTYDLYAAKEEYDTTMIGNVSVTAGNVTKEDIELVPADTTGMN